MGTLVIACGLVVVAIGVWRSYGLAREALGPLVHEGEATRTAVEAARPMHARFRVRLFFRRVVAAVGWSVIALYGVFLAQAGAMAR
jgi:hypothetical protein